MRWSAGVCAFALLLSIPGPPQVTETQLPAPPHTTSFVAALPSDGTSPPLRFRRRLDLGLRKRGVLPSQVEPAFGVDDSAIGALSVLADVAETRAGGDEGWFGRSPDPTSAKGISTSEKARLGASGDSGSGYGNLEDSATEDLDFARIDRELWELELDYEDAAQNLFADLSFRLIQPAGNPFDQALGQELSPLPDDLPPDPDPVDESSNDPVDETSDGPLTGPGPDGTDGVTADSPPVTDTTDTEPEDPEFGFLVIGDFGEDRSEAGVFRAFRDEVGGFVLENEFVFNLPPIITDNNLIFEETDRIVTADLNQDGVLDVIRARTGELGTKLDSYLGRSAGGFEQQAQGFAFHRTVLSMALFDMDGAGEPELVLVTERGSRLILYERSADILQYRKELLLPFAPGTGGRVGGGFPRATASRVGSETGTCCHSLSGIRRRFHQPTIPEAFPAILDIGPLGIRRSGRGSRLRGRESPFADRRGRRWSSPACESCPTAEDAPAHRGRLSGIRVAPAGLLVLIDRTKSANFFSE